MVFSLGPVQKLLLIGGGQLLVDTADIGLKYGLRVFVVTSSRHLEGVDGERFSRGLDQLDLSWVCAESLRAGVNELEQDFTSYTIALSLSNPWIVSEDEQRTLFNRKLMNCHGTRLPRDRGAGGFSWTILSGNRYGIVNLYQMTSSVDGGPILDYEEFIYPVSCRTPRDFEEYYSNKLLEFLENRLGAMVAGDWKPQHLPQIDYLSTYWPRLKSDENGWIDWGIPTADLYRFICAFDDPYGGARTTLNGKEVVVRNCLDNYSDGKFHPFQVGMIYRKTEEWICVATNDGNLIISSVQDVDGNPILDRVKLGDRFVTEISALEQAKQRQFLDPSGWRTRIAEDR